MPLATRTLRYCLFLALMILSVSCDQGTKSWARHNLAGRPDVSVIDGFWDFHFAENPGSAFSLFQDLRGGRYILTAFGIGLVAMLFVWVQRTIARGADDRSWRSVLPVVALALVAGGAIGNLYDRVRFGHVTDFVYWHGHSWRWPIFNVADALLLVGAVALFFSAARPTVAARS